MGKTPTVDLDGILQQRFEMQGFRPGQREAIEALLEKRRVLCIQPTGYGKSLIYQLSALLLDGITLVISPLLALMRDQVEQLDSRFQIPAASINSDQSEAENGAAMQAAQHRKVRILFIAPEKLDNVEMFAFLTRLHVGLVVVDEAHCISTWGHDFRPAYRQIIQAVHAFEEANSDLRVLGLTATANGRVERDIKEQLRGPSGSPLTVLRMSMDRPNIRLSNRPAAGMADKLVLLAEVLPQLEGCGILYCATRENAEIVAEYLSQNGIDVVAYHAGFDPETKRRLQIAFMNGRHKAIASTNALGMGIDKPDLRFIIHVDVPGSITAYYQEVGRAGRDGLPAEGILLFDFQDKRIQEHFIRSAQPSPDDFAAVLGHIRPDSKGQWPALNQVRTRSGLHPTIVTVIMAELQEQGFVEKTLVQRRQVYMRTAKKGIPDLTRYERQFKVRSEELERMLAYGQGSTGCLMRTLRQALGDDEARSCGRCSVCRGELPEALAYDRASAVAWLSRRSVPIASTKRPPMEAGFSLLNGQLRQPLFVEFMRGRAADTDLNPELLAMLRQALRKLAGTYQIRLVAPVPSRTWQQRERTARFIAGELGAEPLLDLLVWQAWPQVRQGELLNNDQRRENVNGHMGLGSSTIVLKNLARDEVVLLLDDYTGSGATIKEAVRALRQEGGLEAAIIPVTIARVRWKLGTRGMI